MNDRKGPLYLALADALAESVLDGRLRPGERLPTHRELAESLSVTVGTVSRGYAEAERRGLVSSIVGRGTYVTSDALTRSSLVHPGHGGGLIEMGLVTPLYGLDPDPAKGMLSLSRRPDCARLLRYVDPVGLLEHREAGTDWIGRYGLKAEADEVVVFAGAQHALACCLGGLFSPGDRVGADELTYPGLKASAAMFGVRVVPVAGDAQGIDPEALDAACRRERLKGLYLMPAVHNPTTRCLDSDRRRAVAGIVRRYGLRLIEDDAYALTRPEPPEPLAALAPEHTVFVAGVSKSVCAGLRVAFAKVPSGLLPPLREALLNTVWMAPPLGVELMRLWIEDGTAEAVAAAKRDEAAVRFAEAATLLSGLEYEGFSSGYFLWLRLPPAWRCEDFEAAARDRGIKVFSARRFAVGSVRVPDAVRISLTGPADREELRRGLGVIVELCSRGAGPSGAML